MLLRRWVAFDDNGVLCEESRREEADSCSVGLQACAVSVYAVFLLAPSLKAFFISYGLTGGIITIVVAMAVRLFRSFQSNITLIRHFDLSQPTLGQTFAT